MALEAEASGPRAAGAGLEAVALEVAEDLAEADFPGAVDPQAAEGLVAAGSPHPPAWSRHLRRIFRPFLNKGQRRHLASVISELERKTTGEIHVHIMGKMPSQNALALAEKKFFELGLDKTKERNAVLLLISHLDHRFAIWGDKGIHDQAGQKIWDKASQELRHYFGQRRYVEGVEACLRQIGSHLIQYYPKADSEPDKNEISNEVSDS